MVLLAVESFATKDLKKTDFKRLWLFTNDDNPNSHSIMEQKAIVTVARKRDCSQAGIELSRWHLHPKKERSLPSESLLLPVTRSGQWQLLWSS